MNKLFCFLLDHYWILKPKPDILSNKRYCKRCNKKQIRVRMPGIEIVDLWEDVANF